MRTNPAHNSARRSKGKHCHPTKLFFEPLRRKKLLDLRWFQIEKGFIRKRLGCHARQPIQLVGRHNVRMGFVANHRRRSWLARFVWVSTIAAGLIWGASANAQAGPPTVQSDTEPNAKAMMARGVEAYDAHNDSVALDIFRKAAAIGDVDAMMYLGVMYGTGRGVGRDYAVAMDWFRRAAEAGNSQAMCNIGLLYLQGDGVPKSSTEAMSWFRKAAAFGNAEAMFNVGVLYRDGLGVPVDYAGAMKWFRTADGAGDITAPNAIGVLYQLGLGVSVDYGEAMNWYRRAAEAGSDTAMYNIGVLWESGLGVPQDREQAIAWYRKAAAAGNQPAKGALQSLGVKD
jgi:TPR repeat protein